MANLYISEYTGVSIGSGQGGAANVNVSAGQEPALVEQQVVYTTSTQSAAFNAQTHFVRIHTDSICSILFGANPTAVITSKRMAANQTEYFGVTPGQKVAAVTNT